MNKAKQTQNILNKLLRFQTIFLDSRANNERVLFTRKHGPYYTVSLCVCYTVSLCCSYLFRRFWLKVADMCVSERGERDVQILDTVESFA